MRILRCPECDSERIVVTMRKHNRSAFAGYKFTPSEWSELTCLQCRRRWRSRAAAVDRLPDAASVRERERTAGDGTCTMPDRHVPGLRCGYPLPCPWHPMRPLE